MSLINCSECDKQVSDKARSCPNCGVPLNSISLKDFNYKELRFTKKMKQAFKLSFWAFNEDKLSRSEYLAASLVLVILSILAILCIVIFSLVSSFIVFSPENYNPYSNPYDKLETIKNIAIFLFICTIIAIIAGNISISIKRSKDMGKPNLWKLLFIPIYNIYISIILLITPSSIEEDN